MAKALKNKVFSFYLRNTIKIWKIVMQFSPKMVISKLSPLILKLLEWLVKSEQVYPIRKSHNSKLFQLCIGMKTDYISALKQMFLSELYFTSFLLLLLSLFHMNIGVWIIENILKFKIKIIISNIQNNIWHILEIWDR